MHLVSLFSTSYRHKRYGMSEHGTPGHKHSLQVDKTIVQWGLQEFIAKVWILRVRRQVQNENDFVALDSWAVPCGSTWMKKNWDKWQGARPVHELCMQCCLEKKIQEDFRRRIGGGG